jgi:hypothetical protein
MPRGLTTSTRRGCGSGPSLRIRELRLSRTSRRAWLALARGWRTKQPPGCLCARIVGRKIRRRVASAAGRAKWSPRHPGHLRRGDSIVSQWSRRTSEHLYEPGARN